MRISILVCAVLLSACTTTATGRRPSADDDDKRFANFERLRVLLASAATSDCEITATSVWVNFGEHFANAPAYPALDIKIVFKKGGEKSFTVAGEPEVKYAKYVGLVGNERKNYYYESFTFNVLDSRDPSSPPRLIVQQSTYAKGITVSWQQASTSLDGKGPIYGKVEELCRP